MVARRTLLALITAVAAFLSVGAAVATYASPRVEFSVFLGIPAGFAAALVGGVVVFVGLSPTATSGRRRRATALAAFGVTFLIALVAAVALFAVQNSTALPVAVAAGAAAALGWLAAARRGYSSSP